MLVGKIPLLLCIAKEMKKGWWSAGSWAEQNKVVVRSLPKFSAVV
jgi:hypothetical protein